jgi:hypothetical protein
MPVLNAARRRNSGIRRPATAVHQIEDQLPACQRMNFDKKMNIIYKMNICKYYCLHSRFNTGSVLPTSDFPSTSCRILVCTVIPCNSTSELFRLGVAATLSVFDAADASVPFGSLICWNPSLFVLDAGKGSLEPADWCE